MAAPPLCGAALRHPCRQRRGLHRRRKRCAAWAPRPLDEHITYSTLVVDRGKSSSAPSSRVTATGASRSATRTSTRASSPCSSPMRTGASTRMAVLTHGRSPAPPGRRSRNGRIVSGGSTLTMQVARLLEPRPERSISDKLAEMIRAVQIEQRLTQDPDPRPLPRACPLWRQHRGHARRLARLFRQGAAPPLHCRGGPARRPSASA